LLIDFVSGRPDRCLRELTVPDVEVPKDPKALPCMLPAEDVIERIAQMRHLPGDCPKTNSKNAAFLLLAKDRLAGLARPACGLTIAYSTMFIGAPGRFIQSVQSLPGMRQRDHSGLERGSRVALASAAFPGLLAHALWFRTCRNALMWFCIVWLLITSFTYWDAALGRSVVQKLTTYTLPLMFGVLGTLISAFRSIYHKMRYLELAPRDLALTFLGLPLGAVAGVAVGLFFSPSVIPMRGDGVVAGNLTLTASGLAFLAPAMALRRCFVLSTICCGRSFPATDCRRKYG
jgi:hypothetical protein